MNKPELLAPCGDFECLKAAVQNGADSVYLGASSFSARAQAKNFNLEELKEAIDYAALRNVRVHLALNTLLTDNEFEEAVKVAEIAYKYGVSALIVQDLGLATYLLKHFPDLPIHASTQMTVHNLDGVRQLEKLGYSRIVLARETPLSEIENICKNTNVEIETFLHGALCISYSGQCLFSSIIGGRSGNRGKCAGPCRLPYELLEENSKLDSGYLLSPKDICSLDILPKLIASGVSCFKIEGRMKTPEYVAIVTKIYRKYIDIVLEKKTYKIDPIDRQNLMQAFNRGGFSTAYFEDEPNRNLIFKEKPNNMGIYVGDVYHFNPNKGHISLTLENTLSIGDKISINNDTYTVSELMINNNNLPKATKGMQVKIGRMKGDIRRNAKIYKLEDKELVNSVKDSFSGKEFKKIPLSLDLKIKFGEPIVAKVQALSDVFYRNISSIEVVSDIVPEKATNSPTTEDRIISQFSKTGNTEYEFTKFNIDLEDGLFIPGMARLNDLRRNLLLALENSVKASYEKVAPSTLSFKENYIIPENIQSETYKDNKISVFDENFDNVFNSNDKKISVLLNIFNKNKDYSVLENVDKLYIPLKYFLNNDYKDLLVKLSTKQNLYIYMPNVLLVNITNEDLKNIKAEFNIKGIIISNISQLELLGNIDFEIIGNYSLNIYNTYNIDYLKETFNMSSITFSPELNKNIIRFLEENSSLPTELICYGKAPLMTTKYCFLGNSTKCYRECTHKCLENKKYYLKDRLGFKFDVYPNPDYKTTTIYNSKITSIAPTSFKSNLLRIDILNESIDEINNIINTVKSGNRFEGQDYTNANLNKEI